MKITFKTTILFVSFFFGFVTQAQNDGSSKIEKNIPLIVVETFNNSFPDKDPVWFSRYQGSDDQELVYRAKFIFDNRYCQAVYDINGNQVVFAATVDYKELPESARNFMKEKYPAFPIVETLLVTDSKKQVTYEIGIYIDNQYVIQVFSKEGIFIKSTKA
tara:strand:+ start:3715 stop:4194 length:480 start_codon:yes stop_codon:yes gene_type:complete